MHSFWVVLSLYAALRTPTPDLHLSISANCFTHNVLQFNQMKEEALSLVEACYYLYNALLINFWLFQSPETALGAPWPGLHLSISTSYVIHLVLEVNQKKKMSSLLGRSLS